MYIVLHQDGDSDIEIFICDKGLLGSSTEGTYHFLFSVVTENCNEIDQRTKVNPELFISNKTLLRSRLKTAYYFVLGIIDDHFSRKPSPII
jgi:hypothetical protein